MKKYRILINPSHNRVYYESAKKLAVAELNICARVNGEIVTAGGVDYIEFETDDIARLLQTLSRLSFTFAIFEMNGELLKPIDLISSNVIGAEINSVLKYQGKTNEQFTLMMLNIAKANLLNSDSRLKLIDPMAGRGTTLFESLRQGIDSYGIEIDQKSTHDSYVHMRKYLEGKKFKHSVSEHRLSGDNKSFKAKLSTVKISRALKDFCDIPLIYEIVEADSVNADKIYKKNTFDLMVTDLPYGVQHASKIGTKGKISRSPLDLLELALPSYYTIMKPSGVVAFSFNANVSSRQAVKELLLKHGFLPLDDADYETMEHRVDQAILRDVVFAIKN